MYFRYKTNNTYTRTIQQLQQDLNKRLFFPNYGPRKKKHKTCTFSKITCWPRMHTIPRRLVHNRGSLYSKQRY